MAPISCRAGEVCIVGIHHRGRMPLSCRLVALSLVIALSACERRAERGEALERDDFGAAVIAGSAASPARIVSLNPTSTEILFAIGAGGRLVGRSQWDLWPDSARLVPALGPGIRPNVEAVLAARPDLVLLYASEDNRPAATRLRAAGIATLALKIDSIGSFRRGTRLLGLATGQGARAAVVVDSVFRTLERVRAATARLERPTVFWHVWDAPIITIGAGSYMSELVEIAGARNVYADHAAPSMTVGLEDVARRDPRWVLAGPVGAAALRARPEWRAVPAVRVGRTLIVDTTLVGRPSVKLGEAAVSLARLLHPGVGL